MGSKTFGIGFALVSLVFAATPAAAKDGVVIMPLKSTVLDKGPLNAINDLVVYSMTKLSPFKRFKSVDILFIIEDIPLLRRIKAVNDVHHHCLAGAIRANDRMNFAFFYF